MNIKKIYNFNTINYEHYTQLPLLFQIMLQLVISLNLAFFDYFNIAKVKDIKYYNNNKNSQLDQYYGYGYVIILIDEWYNNTGANNFYESM